MYNSGYPQKYGHGFVLLCFIFAVSHILVDSCDSYTHILLLRWYCVVYKSWHISDIFIANIIKTLAFPIFFHVDWHKLASNSCESTYANIDQGFILNLGLFICNILSSLVICATNKKHELCHYLHLCTQKVILLGCLWQVHPWFKDKYIGTNHPCACLTEAHPTNWQRDWQVFTGNRFNPLLNEFTNC